MAYFYADYDKTGRVLRFEHKYEMCKYIGVSHKTPLDKIIGAYKRENDTFEDDWNEVCRMFRKVKWVKKNDVGRN